jgi:hypothetical protein
LKSPNPMMSGDEVVAQCDNKYLVSRCGGRSQSEGQDGCLHNDGGWWNGGGKRCWRERSERRWWSSNRPLVFSVSIPSGQRVDSHVASERRNKCSSSSMKEVIFALRRGKSRDTVSAAAVLPFLFLA